MVLGSWSCRLQPRNGYLASRCGFRCNRCRRVASDLSCTWMSWLWLISVMHPHWIQTRHAAFACYLPLLWCLIIAPCVPPVYPTGDSRLFRCWKLHALLVSVFSSSCARKLGIYRFFPFLQGIISIDTSSSEMSPQFWPLTSDQHS